MPALLKQGKYCDITIYNLTYLTYLTKIYIGSYKKQKTKLIFFYNQTREFKNPCQNCQICQTIKNNQKNNQISSFFASVTKSPRKNAISKSYSQSFFSIRVPSWRMLGMISQLFARSFKSQRTFEILCLPLKSIALQKNTGCQSRKIRTDCNSN